MCSVGLRRPNTAWDRRQGKGKWFYMPKWQDSGEVSRVGPGCTVGDGGNVLKDGPGK